MRCGTAYNERHHLWLHYTINQKPPLQVYLSTTRSCRRFISFSTHSGGKHLYYTKTPDFCKKIARYNKNIKVCVFICFLSPVYRTYYKATIKSSTSVRRGYYKALYTRLSDNCIIVIQIVIQSGHRTTIFVKQRKRSHNKKEQVRVGITCSHTFIIHQLNYCFKPFSCSFLLTSIITASYR